MIQQLLTENYTPGRCLAGAPLAIVLHEVDLRLEQLDAEHAECIQPVPTKKHTSFHYGVSGSITHQYVRDEDTAISFGVPPTIAPSWSLPTVNPGVNPDCYTINIAVSTGTSVASSDPNCPTPANVYSQATINSLVSLICALIKEFPAITPDAQHVLIHDATELIGLNLNGLNGIMTQVAACLAAPPPINPNIVNVCSGIKGFTPGTPVQVAGVDAGGNCVLGAFAVHPAANVTNDPAPYSANLAGQLFNIPQVAAAIVGNALTVTVGGVATSYNPLTALKKCGAVAFDPAADEILTCAGLPAALGALPPGAQGVLGGAGTANTYVGADGQLHLLPAVPVDINVGSVGFNAATGEITLTETDGTTHVVDVYPAVVSVGAGLAGDGSAANPLTLAINKCGGTAFDPATEQIVDCATFAAHGHTSGVGVKGDGTAATPFALEASELTAEAAPVITGILAATAANPDGALITPASIVCEGLAHNGTAAAVAALPNLIFTAWDGAQCAGFTLPSWCDGLKSITPTAFDNTLPVKLLQVDVAGDCKVVDVPTALSCNVNDYALTQQGWRRVREGLVFGTVGVGQSINPDTVSHYEAIGSGFTVTPPTNTACAYKLTITNLEAAGADVSLTVTSLNGTSQVLTLIGFANPAWLSMFGENNQGESLSLAWNPTAGTYRLVEG